MMQAVYMYPIFKNITGFIEFLKRSLIRPVLFKCYLRLFIKFRSLCSVLKGIEFRIVIPPFIILITGNLTGIQKIQLLFPGIEVILAIGN